MIFKVSMIRSKHGGESLFDFAYEGSVVIFLFEGGTVDWQRHVQYHSEMLLRLQLLPNHAHQPSQQQLVKFNLR